jgi:hypothetical protein
VLKRAFALGANLIGGTTSLWSRRVISEAQIEEGVRAIDGALAGIAE